MKRDYGREVIAEAARLFECNATELFAGSKYPIHGAAEAAVIYTLWITDHSAAAIGRFSGEVDIIHKVRICVTTRKENPEYDTKVSELVWFAQRWNHERAA